MVICNSEWSCYKSSFNGVTAVNCNGYLACLISVFNYAIDMEHNMVTCNGSYACQWAKFNGLSADVNCIGDSACYGTTFTYPIDTKNYIIICNGYAPCGSAQFYITDGRLNITNGNIYRSEQIIKYNLG
eukprot:83310_1